VIKNVEDFDAQLKPNVFRQSGVFEQRHICSTESRTDDNIPAEVSKMKYRDTRLHRDRQSQHGPSRTTFRVAWIADHICKPLIRCYPNLISATDFVNRLNSNAGGVLTNTQRSELISELSPNPTDPKLRADVLKKIAESPQLQKAEFHRAFVLMQYFGYLRRNPDDAPDFNFDGYKFWLEKLDHFQRNFEQAEMVKAFIQSHEYRSRFGS